MYEVTTTVERHKWVIISTVVFNGKDCYNESERELLVAAELFL